MKAILRRLDRIEQSLAPKNRPSKIEFAYLKLLPRESSGPRQRVKVGQRPDGRDEYEERPGEPPPNQAEAPGPQRDEALLGEGTGDRQLSRKSVD
jgi:hypothetical protein